jgi:hypothetical protein
MTPEYALDDAAIRAAVGRLSDRDLLLQARLSALALEADRDAAHDKCVDTPDDDRR